MKRLIKASMCFLLMLGLSGIQGVSAEGISTYTGDAEVDENPEIYKNDIVMTTVKDNNLAQKPLIKIEDLHPIEQTALNFLNDYVKEDDFYIETTLSNPELFDKESISNFTYREMFGACTSTAVNRVTLNTLIPVKEGKSILDVKMTNKKNPSEVYYGSAVIEISDIWNKAELVTNYKEINISMNQLFYFSNQPNTSSSRKVIEEHAKYNTISDIRTLDVGLKDEENEINGDVDREIRATISDENIINYGRTFSREENGMFTSTNSRQLEDNAFKRSHQEGICYFGGFGGGSEVPFAYAITPKKVGTSYITFSYGSRSVTVKVNVSNLSDEPTDKLPSDIADEFYSDSNEKVNVNLSNPDNVNSDIFKASKDTGKDVTFNILGENNKTQYAWTFNGSTLTNPDMNLDLSLTFDSDKKKEIESLAKDTELFYLNFAHHGALPGVANMKVDVSSKYKDGEEIYLYYYNEEKGMVEQTGDKVIVKDGYAEFAISHCSTYFFTSKSVENTGKDEITTPKNPVIDNTPTDNPPTENGSDVIKNTARENVNSSQVIIITLLALVIAGSAIALKRKHS